MLSETVIIPTHGRPRLLEQTLDSLSRCHLPDSYEELIVIENGSRAGASALVEALPERLNARYMHRNRGNKSYALNQALETSTEGLVVFLDDDVRVSPKTLVAYAESAKTHGPGHFFGGPVKVDREVDPPEPYAHLFPCSVRGYDLVESCMGEEYLGFNWAAYTSDLNAVGGFNTELGPGDDTVATVGDESDLQQRLIKTGCHGVDVCQAKVTHFVPAASTTLSWLLDRRIEKGKYIGFTSRLSFPTFCVRLIWRIVVLIMVLGKGVIKFDKKKVVYVIASGYQKIGELEGCLSKYRKKK